MSNHETKGKAEGTMFEAGFDRLRPGDSFQSAPCLIEARDVDVFAALTGDHHPIHVDAGYAAAGPFGQPIAHGMLVLSCAVGALPLDPDRIIALRRIRNAVFKRPLAVGESIVVHSTVSGLRALDAESGLVEAEWRILGADDAKLRVRAAVEIVWRRDAGEAGPEEPRVTAATVANFQPRTGGDDELSPIEVSDDGLRVLV